MRLVEISEETIREQIKELPERWLRYATVHKSEVNPIRGGIDWSLGAYSTDANEGDWKTFRWNGLTCEEIYKGLKNLPDNAGDSDVIKIMGEYRINEWVRLPLCWPCQLRMKKYVELAEDSDNGSICFCESCIRKALQLLK